MCVRVTIRHRVNSINQTQFCRSIAALRFITRAENHVPEKLICVKRGMEWCCLLLLIDSSKLFWTCLDLCFWLYSMLSIATAPRHLGLLYFEPFTALNWWKNISFEKRRIFITSVCIEVLEGKILLPVLFYTGITLLYSELWWVNWIEPGSGSAHVPVQVCTDCIVPSWSGRWRSAPTPRLRWTPAPPPPSSLHRFWELPVNPMKAHWVFFCSEKRIPGTDSTHDVPHYQILHTDLLFITCLFTDDVLSPIRGTPGEYLSSLLGVCRQRVILQLGHGGDL